jgi:hypothetical protein
MSVGMGGGVMGGRIVSVAGLVIVVAWAGAATPAAAEVSACDGQWSVVSSADHSQQCMTA